MRVAIAQINPVLGNIEKNKKKMIENIEKAKGEGVDLIVFPELALSGYLLEELVFDVAGIPSEFYELSKEISILFGGVEECEDNYFYNSAFYLEDGELKFTHRKVYLPSYGLFDESRYFKAGDRIKACETKFGKIGILVCEDAWHISTGYILNQDGADYIFCLTNSPSRGAYEGSEKLSIAESWEAMNKTYANLFGSYYVFAQRVGYEDGVNFWGGSEIVSPTGEVKVKAKYFEEDMIIANLTKEEVRRARIINPTMKNERFDMTIRELKRIQNNKMK